MRRRVLLFALSLAACGETPVGLDSGPAEDAGAVDSGAKDAGPKRDSGGPSDTGVAIDSGAMDAGLADLPDVDAGRAPACEATSPRAVSPEISVLPEDGEAPYVDVLRRADRSIRVFAYLMGYGGILDTLEAKAKAGVSVQVIMDVGKRSTNQKYADRLTQAGAEIKWSNPVFPYMHAKTFVVDDDEAVVSTGNYSKDFSIDVERNYVARLTDPDDVADLAALFAADWNGMSPDVSCTRILVSPLNSKSRIISAIRAAKRTIDIESMQFADRDVRSAVLERAQHGVAVRALLAPISWIDANASAAEFLATNSIPARWMEDPNVHVKAIIIDGESAYMGSVNLSMTSLTQNREIGLILNPGEGDGVAAMSRTFEHDWSVATPF